MSDAANPQRRPRSPRLFLKYVGLGAAAFFVASLPRSQRVAATEVDSGFHADLLIVGALAGAALYVTRAYRGRGLGVGILRWSLSFSAAFVCATVVSHVVAPRDELTVSAAALVAALGALTGTGLGIFAHRVNLNV